ncbi:unnamed protein product [Zymoseptoria tritici ST99CH_3D1]|nr:unnamed protein product [Zymoseptoria tritici ST99CH_3D1]
MPDPRFMITETPSEEHRRQLIEGFGFSRWFLITYQAAVLGVVLLTAARHQYKKWTLSTRSRRRGEKANEQSCTRKDDFKKHPTVFESEWTSSCSGSSRTGDVSPPSSSKGKFATENDSLLTRVGTPEKRTSARATQRMRRWLKATLMYQPPPVPILHRIMPENSTTFCVLALLALNIFYLLYHVDFSTLTSIEVIAGRSGLLFVANLPWLYMLAAKNQPLKALTGHSYENLNLLHRRQGELLCFLAVIHFSGMLFAWWRALRPFLTLYRFLTFKYILLGDCAFVAYEVLYFTSLSSFREWWYEMFLASHVFLQAAGLVLLFFHHFRSRPYVGASLAIFLLDRIVWRMNIKTKTVRADLLVMKDGETVKVSADWSVSPRSRTGWRFWLGGNMSHGWEASQHVFLTVPGISKQHVLQCHPMTIASAAPEPGQDHAWFNLIIRAKSGFSRDLLHYAQDHASTKIRLDGPYGSLHALDMLHASDISIVVAGGSGIAVAYPMIWSLLHSESRHGQQICLISVVQDASHTHWSGTERLQELKTLGLHLITPPPSRKYGRPDVAALLCDNVHQLLDHAECADDDSKISVVVSGPDSLNRSVRNTCSRLVREGLNVDVAVEKFGW